jgi:hypothetical protein
VWTASSQEELDLAARALTDLQRKHVPVPATTTLAQPIPRPCLKRCRRMSNAGDLVPPHFLQKRARSSLLADDGVSVSGDVGVRGASSDGHDDFDGPMAIFNLEDASSVLHGV